MCTTSILYTFEVYKKLLWVFKFWKSVHPINSYGISSKFQLKFFIILIHFRLIKNFICNHSKFMSFLSVQYLCFVQIMHKRDFEWFFSSWKHIFSWIFVSSLWGYSHHWIKILIQWQIICSSTLRILINMDPLFLKLFFFSNKTFFSSFFSKISDFF